MDERVALSHKKAASVGYLAAVKEHCRSWTLSPLLPEAAMPATPQLPALHNPTSYQVLTWIHVSLDATWWRATSHDHIFR